MSLLCVLAFLCNTLSAQYVYTIKADSVKLTNCDSSELIIENHTQNVLGFLFNTGNGRTIFKHGALTLSAHDWPDYVFDSTYHLPSPDSLRHYIKQNSHLPDAPSAAEVDRRGVDVGDNQKLLLKKIEELTLYMLKQEERIQNLKQQLQQQNKTIRSR